MNQVEMPIRQYAMSNATLIQSAEMLKIFLERDASDLSSRGIGAAQITELETLTTEFAELKPDSWWRSNTKLVVEQRDAARTDIQYTLEEIREICLIVFKPSPTYDSFQFDGINRTNNMEFVVRVRTVIDRATEHTA